MIQVIGTGPGSPEYLTLKAIKEIEAADYVAGWQPALRTVKDYIRGETIEVSYANEAEKLKYLAAKSRDHKCVFCCVGDPDFSDAQLLAKISRLAEIDILPGISSTQVAASKARVAWENAVFISLHKSGSIAGAKADLVRRLKESRDVILLPRPYDFMPEQIAGYLMSRGISPDVRVSIYENLTLEEKELQASLKEVKGEFSDLCVMVIKHAAG